MIKKLDKLVLKSFIGPFVATFFITLFVLVLQFFWKYIDDLVGKGLDTFTIIRLTGYVSATAVPLALPLAVLLSSIMTFGNLGESFESVAVKSSGIPLLRFMRPLLIVALLICGIAFMFANYIIPVANLKFNTLLYDITISKPAFDIREGVFYDKIDGYVIKIGKKDKDNSTIHNVVIFERSYSLQDKIIAAESGTMNISSDRKFLEFHLRNGWRYEERGASFGLNTEYYRLGFKEYKKVFDLSSFKLNKTPDSLYKDNYRMLNVKQLTRAIDSLDKSTSRDYETKMKNEVYSNFAFGKWGDTGWKNIPAIIPPQTNTYEKSLPDSARRYVMSRAIERLTNTKNSLDQITEETKLRQKDLRYHMIEWHRKFALSMACFVLFLIGAPLGSIIRKGGLGMPLVIAVIFFLVFHLLNMFGEKFAKTDVLSAFAGMWLSTIILIPVGIFLTYKAMHDSQLFNKEWYYRSFHKLRALLGRSEVPKAQTEPA